MRAILERDFLSQAARPRGILLRGLLAALVVAPVLVIMADQSHRFRLHPDDVARDAFLGGVAFLLGAVAVLTPPLAVGAILVERVQDTLPLVLATPIGERRLALAKLLARSAVVLTWSFAALPALALLSLLGGVSTMQVVDLAVLLVAVVVELAAWALYVSTASRKYATATVAAYLLPAARWAVTLIGAMVVLEGWERRSGPPPGSFALESVVGTVQTTPFLPIWSILDPGSYLATGMQFKVRNISPMFWVDHPVWLYLIASFAFAAVSIEIAARRLRRESEPRSSWFTRSKRMRRWFRKPPGDGNPVLWKEAHLLNTAGSRPLYYMVLALFMLSLLVGLAATVASQPDLLFGILAGMVTITALVAAINAATSIGHEKTQGSLDLVRVSLLTPLEILRGKWLGVLRGLGLLAVLPLFLCILAAFFGRWQSGLFGVVLLVTIVGAWSAIGFRVGIAAMDSRTAVIRLAMVAASVFIGGPLLFAFLEEGLGLPRGPEEFFAGLLLVGCPPITSFMCQMGLEEQLHRVRGYHDLPFGWALAWLLLNGWFAVREWFLLPGRLKARLNRERDL